MDDPDESAPVAGDPAEVAETLQRHLGAGPDTERVGALQPVVETVAGWRDPAEITPQEWLAALEATPDVLYLRTEEGVLRHRPEVTGDGDPAPFRLVRTGDDAQVEPLEYDDAAAVVEGAVVSVGVVSDLPVEIRARFLSRDA